MKMLRKLVSIVSAATLLTSSLAFTFSASAATVEETAQVSSEPNIQKNVQDGVILHAFNWSYNSIKNNLPSIAAAGYSTVQTSPVQQPKDYGTSTDIAGQWWKPYQPVSLSFAKSSWFGTKADLTALCTEADKYGIKIICDIVSNHLANNLETDPYSISSQVKTYEPSIYAAKSTSGSAYWHGLQQGASDGNQQSVVQGHIGMPDLNTSNTTVQNLVKNLLNDCIQCGVDGFRFDAAKHIETPSDGSYASNYWTNVLNYAKQQYKSKTGGDLYVYGEILNTPGSGRQWSWYTNNNLMKITDNATGNSALAAVKNGNASQAASSGYKTGQAASNVVLWAESHDTYMNPKDANYSAKVPNDKIVKTWAIVGARKDATALFFARPGTNNMGEATTDLTYKSVVVSEINKFHNAFVGKSEKLGSSGVYAYVQRGGAGIVISNVSGNGGNVSLSGTGLADGTYVDTVTGNEFKCSGGTVSGTMGSTGVAVVYKSTSTPTATSSVESGSFYGETMTTTLKFENATSATYCLDNSTPVAYTNGTTIRIGSDYNYGETINLTLTATDKNGQTKEYKYQYKKEKDQSSGVYIFFDKAHSTWSSWTEPYHAYIFDEVTKSKNPTYTAGGWPGLEMKYDSKLGLYYVEVPKTCYATDTNNNSTTSDFDLSKSSNTCVVINGALSSGGTSLGQYPPDSADKTKQVYMKLNGKSHIYGASGRQSWTETNLVPTKVEVQATNVTKGQAASPTTAKPTQAPTTAKPTQAPTYAKTFNVTADSNMFPKNVTTYDSSTKKLTVSYFINCSYGLLNCQWALRYDGSVLKFNEADNSKTNDDDEVISTVMPKASTAVINAEPADIEYGIRGNCTNIRLYKLSTKDGGQVGFVTVTFEVLKPVDTTVSLEVEEMAISTIRPGKTESNPEDDLQLVADSEVSDVPVGYTLVTSNYQGGYNESYVNAKDPKIVHDPTGDLPTQPATQPATGGTPVILGYYGDVDGDEDVTTDDVTMIQLYLNRQRVKFNDLQQILADVDGDDDVTIDDVSAIQRFLSNARRKRATERTGDPYYGDGPAPSTDPVKPTSAPKPTTAGDSFTVKATSNLFPENTVTFDKSTKKLTTTFFVNAEKDLLDCQWTLKYDGSALRYSEANNTIENADGDLILNVMPCATDAIINSEPEGMTDAILGNFTSLRLAKLSNKTTGKVAFVSVTFDVISPADTEVDLQVEEMSISKRAEGKTESDPAEEDQLTYMSKVYDVRVPYTLTTAIYANGFDKNHTSLDDAVLNYTPSSNPEVPTYPSEEPTPYVEPTEEPTPYVEPTYEPGPVPEPGSFQFSDSLGWGDIHVYAWDAEGNALLGEWPGAAGVEGAPNDFGQMVYTINVPEGAAGVIVNGGGNQTDDITNFAPEGGGYYVDASRTTTNNDGTTVYVPIPWGGGEEPTHEPGPIIGGGSFQFSDALGWGDIHVYAWDAEGNAILGEWPGASGVEGAPNDFGQMVYTINVPENAAGVIVNGGGNQTEDITNFAPAGGGYYVDASRTTTNNDGTTVYVAIPWDETIVPGPEPGPGGSFQFSDALGWGDIHVYAWDANGNALLGEWPGASGVEGAPNDYGQMVYTINVPEGAVGVIVNGNGKQTDNITNFAPGGGGYYVDASRTTANEFGATVYVPIPWDETTGGDDPYNPGPITGGGSFQFSDALGWGDIHVYAWDANGNSLTGDWPGQSGAQGAPNDYGQMVYTINVPEGAVGVIVNGNGKQTDNITNFAPGGGGYYVDASRTSTNEFGATVYVPIPWDETTGGGDDPYNPGPISGDGGSFQFSDALGWGDIHVYAWDADGNSLTGDWPGQSGAQGAPNDYGQMVYTINVPAGAAGVIVNGNGNQTDNITNFAPGGGGYYVDASRTTTNEFGTTVYVPIPWDETTGGGDDPYNPGPISGDGGSFKFSDSLHWGDIHLYAWDANGNALTGDWPGQAGVSGEMNDYGEMVYTINVPAGAVGVIVNGNGNQTDNITNFAPGGGGYYVSASNTSTNEFGTTVYVPIPWS